MDDKSKKDGRDRSKINSNEEYELKYVADKHNVSIQQVRDAIAAVGNDREKVEGYLKRGR